MLSWYCQRPPDWGTFERSTDIVCRLWRGQLGPDLPLGASNYHLHAHGRIVLLAAARLFCCLTLRKISSRESSPANSNRPSHSQTSSQLPVPPSRGRKSIDCPPLDRPPPVSDSHCLLPFSNFASAPLMLWTAAQAALLPSTPPSPQSPSATPPRILLPLRHRILATRLIRLRTPALLYLNRPPSPRPLNMCPL